MDSSGDRNSGDATRRQILAGMGAAWLVLTVNSAWGPISPAEARAKGAPFRHLSAAEGRTLDSLAEVLLPGAAEMGVAHYVDDQLGRDVPLLFLNYMDYPGDSLDFYRLGLQSLERLSQTRWGKSFDAGSAEEKAALLTDLSRATPSGWSGPPAPLFYLVARNDAVDVYYGTPQGFEKLGVPYSALLKPPENW